MNSYSCADSDLNIQPCRSNFVKSMSTKDTIPSNCFSSWVVWIAPVLVLNACSASNPLDPNDQAINPPTAPINISQANINQSPSATVDVEIALTSSEQPGSANIDVPKIGAATPADNKSTTDSLDPEETVACNAPIEHIQQRTTKLINEARLQPRNCGTDSFEATTAVSWNTQLLQAADKHSADMTQHNFFDHTGSDSSSVATRVDETGYEWRAIGENIAAGQRSAAEVIAGWLNSPGHCRNLMNPAFAEVAVTCAEDSGADYTRYWTNVLAAPQ